VKYVTRLETENAELNAERITKHDAILKYRNDRDRIIIERADLNEQLTAKAARCGELETDNTELKEQIGRYEDVKKLIMLTKESTAKDSVLHKYCLEFLEPLTTPPKENTDD